MPAIEEIVREIGAMEGVATVVGEGVGEGAWFFFYDPRRDQDPTKRQPFATVVTRDDFDAGASALEARGAFRVNLGVKPETYRARFGPLPAWNRSGGAVETGHDHAREDVLLPHPVYAPMGWVCVVNPSDATWRALRPLLEEAYETQRRHVTAGRT
ncbi:MAG: hypothetical protein QOE90_1022 [Thermoplasmata archaeon]|jgi:hypothetical protein|nr:hypothetical protein [Thermoplasmata archaeon]